MRLVCIVAGFAAFGLALWYGWLSVKGAYEYNKRRR